MTLQERFDFMLTCPDRFESISTEHLIVDTRDHLPFLCDVVGTLGCSPNVLEIGCDVGNSTTALLLGTDQDGGFVTSVDINPKCVDNFPDSNHWRFIHGNSRALEVQSMVRRAGPFDLLYIDGDHSYNGARGDIEVYGEMVRPGGLILVHDVLHPEFPGVCQAFEEFPVKDKYIRPGSWGLGVIQL